MMSTHKNIYGYLNASLHYADYKKAVVETEKNPYLLSCFFENNPEEIAYKACWDVYLDGRY